MWRRTGAAWPACATERGTRLRRRKGSVLPLAALRVALDDRRWTPGPHARIGAARRQPRLLPRPAHPRVGGGLVPVFREGTISLDLDPMAGKSGTARLAKASGVPVTPVGLWGTHRIMFKGRRPD